MKITSHDANMTAAKGHEVRDSITDVIHMSPGLRVYYDDVQETPKEERNEPPGGSSAAVDQEQLASSPQPLHKRVYRRWVKFYHQNSFLVLVCLAFLLAYAYPPLGAIYLQPQITAKWIAVIFIFLMAGMGLRSEELSKAFQRVYFNTYIQVFNFLVVSGIVYGFSRLMLHLGALPESLADGMTIASTLSVSVNMGIVLTKVVGGDEAAAVFDAAFGNFLGVFVSPALIVMYLGLSANVDLASVTLKLFLRVVLPLMVGQFLRNFIPPAKAFVIRYGRYFRDGQELCLAFIIYTIFCKTFIKGTTASVADVFIMIGCVLFVLTFLMTLAWTSLRLLFPRQPKLQAMGLFGCTHKTVAVGIPLIETIYHDSPLVGLYVLPLLIWYTMQLVLGTAAAPYIAAYIIRREGELAQATAPQPDNALEMAESGASGTAAVTAPSPDETTGSIDSGSPSSVTASKQVENQPVLPGLDEDDGASEPHQDAIMESIELGNVTNDRA
jgi:sodium/bile acid cotransporter 7